MQAAAEDDDHDEIFPDIPDPEDGSAWQAPADLEEHLYELARADDAHTYLRAIAVEGVYQPVSRADATLDPQKRPLLTVDAGDGRKVAQVYTAGLLPRPHPHVVYEFVTLGTLAQIWPDDVDVLVVNCRTPCEQYFLTTEDEREVWADLHRDHFRPSRLGDRIDTRRTGAPAPGPLLHGLACGAHLCFANGDAWNTLDWHGTGYSGEVERLQESWGVRTRDDWLGMQERLLSREVSPWYWDFVLDARNSLAREQGTPVDAGLWRRCVEVTLRNQLRKSGGPDTPHRPGDDAELDAFVGVLRDLVGKVLRYEARFRADGLLAPDGLVRTVAAWDIGRASKMARWGRGSRHATQAELHRAVERAGDAARSAYSSWEEFSAGYILGRCLHFDEEEFGEWYTDVLYAHRALTTDPDSPWLTVPFHC
ncbi:DUF1266 domain-containing protein [Streptomyces sp. NBC_01142]|uniref:DUF1266 domain-containing protein n=1 Tax=Streptomyces sp. NBC_01142 TaxID=2975865 RepID=UPI0022556AD2|nr:DUF1266 domain-containing protein [Streptomyces sp. NBC_01142]MCX4820024.1 DUF1266 domain-containing protein [Streptomyces sp. NBC_01142]